MKLTVYLITLVVLFSCVKKPVKRHMDLSEKEKNPSSVFNTLTMLALNLSEDMSQLSTKNAEVFVLIYDYSDTNKLNAPLASSQFIFDKEHPAHSIRFNKTNRQILFFIEEDSFRNIEQIEPVIRVYFKEIQRCNTYNELMKYLGEDDLLGIQILEATTRSFSISGRNSLDKYEYSFSIK